MKVNIFKYATSELSQDAFLCWLIANSHPQYADNADLHKAACGFVYFLINQNGEWIYDKPIEEIEVFKQQNHIDISFVVNKEVKVIIEDKTDTDAHNGQLERYKKDEEERLKDSQKLVCIYLKIGNETLSSLHEIEKKGYRTILRKDILNVLSQYEVKNDFYIDYITHIQDLEDKTNAYLNVPYDKWKDWAWQGFYMSLEEHLKWSSWSYVSNPAGGFWGMSWYWAQKSDCKMYLQIEKGGKLCIKIEIKDKKNASAIRNKWHKNLMKQCKLFGYNEVYKPQRFGFGKWITIGCIAPKNYITDIFNRNKILDNLRKYEDLIDKCVD